MKTSSIALLTGFFVFSAEISSATNLATSVLNQFNVFTGDYLKGGETEGPAFIANELILNSGVSQLAFNGGSVQNDSTNVLWLNNGISATSSGQVRLLSGSAVSRVSVDPSRIFFNGNGAGAPSLNQGESAWQTALDGLGVNLTTARLTNVVQSASRQWQGLTPNSTSSQPGNGSLFINATPTSLEGHQVAIVNIDGALLDSNTFDRFETNLSGSTSLLINVSGTDLVFRDNFGNGFQNNETQILFNFYEAENLQLNSNFRGNVLAPFADVVQGGSNIDGSIISESFSQNAEVHDLRFEGVLPFIDTSVAPEPSAMLLSLIGCAFLFRRRVSKH